MLLGGKVGCQQCTCVPCDACTRTCQNPHTGTAFEAVYTRYFEGAEDGNPSDGYLSATGDSDTSDPYDGMDGTGPWFQQVAGTFTLDSSTTRHPCSVTVSFWRNNYVLGAATIPPPATTTTMNRIRVSVSASSGTGVFVEGAYVAIGDTLDLNVTIPLVTGGGDQSTNDPRTSDGTATVTPQCHNRTAIFTVEARLEWNVKKRQHVVYGLVRECYEIGTPCSNYCGTGVAVPDELYVTLTSLSLTNATGWSGGSAAMATFNSALAAIDGVAIVLDRVPGFCTLWNTTLRSSDAFSWSGTLCSLFVQYDSYAGLLYLYAPVNYAPSGNVIPLGGCNEALVVSFAIAVACISGTAFYDDGAVSSSSNARVTSDFGSYGGFLMDASTDWVIES